MRRLVTFLCFAIAAISLYCQELTGSEMGYDYPRTLSSLTVNPSPEATAMYRYQDCPVSYATGTAEISVPLLECRSGDLGIALSIPYRRHKSQRRGGEHRLGLDASRSRTHQPSSLRDA